MPPRLRLWLARLAAPAALLLAATVAVLLVRSALDTAGQETRTTTTTAASRPNPPPSKQPAKTRPKPRRQFYRVQAGDTLATIADQYGTTVEELLLLNPQVDPIELAIGQRIRVQ